MMTKPQLLMMWEHLGHTHGIGLRAIAALPTDKLDSHPIPKMRTPKELVIHMYDQVVRDMIEGVGRGEVVMHDENEKKYVTTIKSTDELVAFARDTWTAMDKVVRNLTEPQLVTMVKTPFGMDLPGFVLMGTLQDEYLHHRGQLYAYLRTLGADVPMIWDFEHNEPAYRPKQQATV